MGYGTGLLQQGEGAVLPVTGGGGGGEAGMASGILDSSLRQEHSIRKALGATVAQTRAVLVELPATCWWEGAPPSSPFRAAVL